MTTVTRFIIPTLAVILLTTGCYEEPDDVFRDCQEAMRSGDYYDFWDCMSQPLQQRYGQYRKVVITPKLEAFYKSRTADGSNAQKMLRIYIESTGMNSAEAHAALSNRDYFNIRMKGAVAIVKALPRHRVVRDANILLLQKGVVRNVDISNNTGLVEVIYPSSGKVQSRHHFKFLREDNRWKIDDLGADPL
jgi:hypothetical protein